MFYRLYHMLGHKINFNKFKSIEIISSIFSDHNGAKVEIKYRKQNGKNKQHATKKKKKKGQYRNQRGNKKVLMTNENKNTALQNLWEAAKVVLRGNLVLIQVYLKKQEKAQINNLSYHLKGLEKEKQTKPKV